MLTLALQHMWFRNLLAVSQINQGIHESERVYIYALASLFAQQVKMVLETAIGTSIRRKCSMNW